MPRVWLRRATATLKFRLALASMLVIALSVGVTTKVLLHQVEKRTERAVLDLESATVERLAKLLSTRVVGLQVALRAVAGDFSTKTLASPDAIREELRSHTGIRTMFARVFVALPDGQAIGVAAEPGSREANLNVADRQYFRETISTGRPVVSEPILSRVANEPSIVFTMPILRADSSVAAVLCATMRLGEQNLMMDLVESSLGDEEPMRTMVVDVQGRILAHTSSVRLMRDAETEPGLSGAMQRWVAQGRPIEPTPDALHDEGHLVARAGVPGTDWLVFRVGVDDAVMGGLVTAQADAWRIGAEAAIAGGLLLLGLLSWMLRPLSRLRYLASRPDDVIDDAAWPRGADEIGQLGRALRQALQGRQRAALAQAAALQKMSSVLSAAPIGIAFTRDRKFELVGREFATLLGYELDELIGRPAGDIYVSEEEYKALGPRVGAAFATGKPFFDELRFLRRDGSFIWGRLQGRPVDAGDANAGTIWLLEDVTRRRAERERVNWSASHDALTRLHNRESFEQRLDQLLAETPPVRPASLLFIDLDRFKAINDGAGHAAGDAVLKDVATMLISLVRPTDLAARMGGDEFAVLLPQCAAEPAQRIGERIREAAQLIGVDHEGRRLNVGASIGLVEIGHETATAAELLARADAACYDAKHAGRNAVRAAPASPSAPALRVVVGTGTGTGAGTGGAPR